MDLWQKAFQLSVDAYYAGDRQRGVDACEALLASQELPPDIELQTRRNFAFYAQPLNELLPSVETWPVHLPPVRGRQFRSPSIASADNLLRMLVSTSLADVSPDAQSTAGFGAQERKPDFYLVDLAPDLDPGDVRIIQEARQPGPVGLGGAGNETARLFSFASSWWISSSGGSSADGHDRVTLRRLDGDAVQQRQHLSVESGQHVFRDWLPAVSAAEDTLRFVASLSPVRLLRYLGAAGVAPVSTYLGSPLLRWGSSGTQLLQVADGWLGIMQEAVDFEGGGRAHLHRFIWLDAAWSLARISRPWVFQSATAEAAGGIVVRGDELIISYSREEHGVWLAIAPLAEVMQLLVAPLDTATARRQLRQLAATAVAAGALPAPAQPAPLPATIEPQDPLPAVAGMTMTGDLLSLPASAPVAPSPAEEPHQASMLDQAVFSGQLPEHTDDARGYVLLAEALAEAGRLDEAIAAFRIAASLANGDDAAMGAQAMYRAAECFLTLDRPVDAVEALTIGMARHAGLGELPWLAAYASWQANRPAQAAYWARRAVALGHFAGQRGVASRDEPRRPAALWEGPFDILRFALRRLGDDAGADEAESLFQAAKRAREATLT